MQSAILLLTLKLELLVMGYLLLVSGKFFLTMRKSIQIFVLLLLIILTGAGPAFAWPQKDLKVIKHGGERYIPLKKVASFYRFKSRHLFKNRYKL